MKFGSSAAGGGAAWFGIWNMWNRALAEVCVQDTTSSYSVTSTQGPLVGVNNRISVLHGLDLDAVRATATTRIITTASDWGKLCIGLDSTTASAAQATDGWLGTNNLNGASVHATFTGMVGVGFHFLQAQVVQSAATAVTAGGGALLTKFNATLWW